MSAFIVADGTMDLVVSAILKLREDLGRGQFGEIIVSGASAGDTIGRKLYALNSEAIRQRYGDKPEVSRYRWQPAGYNTPIRWLKAVQCLIYQCSEGDVVETALYAELQKIRHELSIGIINDLPEYQAAPWDCDRLDARYKAA